MLAKVPIRRVSEKSSFAALTGYISKDAAAVTHSPEVWSVETAAEEMQQVASFSRAKDPVYHYILSWRAGENPSDTQAFDAVTATLIALRMHQNQWVAAVHRNTPDIHAHVAVNRVNPETYKAVPIFRDWLVLDRTCREIEISQGWTHDRGPHRVQVADGNEPQVVSQRREWSDDLPAAPSTKARNFEAWNGQESFQSWLGKGPAQSIKRLLEQHDPSWQGVHRTLGAYNLEYRIKGSGAVIVDLTEPENLHAKASHLGRFASRTKLEARLGPFWGSPGAPGYRLGKSYRSEVEAPTLQTSDRARRSELRKRFEQARSQWHNLKGSTREVLWQQQRESERKRFAKLREEKRTVRQRIRTLRRPPERQLFYSVAVLASGVKREELRSKIRQERGDLRAKLRRQSPGAWRAWLVGEAEAGDQLAAEELGHLRCGVANHLRTDKHLLTASIAKVQGPILNTIVGSLTAVGNASGVYFVDKGRTIFCDQGARLVFHDLSDDYIKAGLALAREKWERGIYLSGNRCIS